MSEISFEEYKLSSIYIIESISDKGEVIRGTCFSISNKMILTAGHNIISGSREIKVYFSSDHYNRNEYIFVKCIYSNEKLDIAIMETLSENLNSFINLYSTNLNIDNEVLSCGYPVEKEFYHAPIKVKITNNFDHIVTREYSFEVSQSHTVSTYLGMSGSPIIYNGSCVGVLVVQQGRNTLYAVSTKDILNDKDINDRIIKNNINIKVQDGVDYNSPAHPTSPFKYCINCNKDSPNIKGVDIGFKFKKWNIIDFTETVYDWIIDYCLSIKEQANFVGGNRKLFKYAKLNYPLNNLDALGDLCLHIAIRESYKTIPIMNKVFDINNKTFSCTHAVLNFDSLELWIGASSVSKTIEEAVESAIKNIEYIMDIRSLGNRFFALTNQIDNSWPHKDKLERLSNANLSIDERFDKIIIPVFLMHDSDIINKFDKENFLVMFNDHIKNCRTHIKSIIKEDLVDLIDLRVFCFPVADIQALNNALIQEINS